MALERVEGLVGNDVLYAAGVLGRDFRVHAHCCQPLRQQSVALVYLLRYLAALVEQRDAAVVIDLDVASQT